MQQAASKKAILYAMLFGVSVFLLFPFYWVLISSVKTVDGLSMNPPMLYPSEFRNVDRELPAAGRIVEAGGDSWFRLARSPDLGAERAGAGEPGAYYVRLNEDAPSQLTRWWSDTAVSRLSPAAARITFAGSEVVALETDGRRVAVVSRMIRQSDSGFDELLFVVPPDGEATEIEILSNVDYSRVTRWKTRFENYPETLRGPEASFGEESTGFLKFSRNSFFIGVMAVVGQLLSSSLVAFAFARLKFRGREVLFVLLLATMMIPGQVTLVPLFSIYKSLGWIDTFLPLIVPHFTAGAFNVFLLRQYMLTLPRELDESAQIDGCGPLRTYFFVILPNCVPVLIVVGLFTFVATWQDVLGPLIYLDNPEYRTVTLGLEYFRSPYVDNRHLLMTGAVLAMLPVAVLFLFFQRFIISGVATSGIKA
ncbi:MAG: carbohydrate ABC transporter permease [Proteobacteria bacterium]|nr:carbohydrate ABC transporter permease [Pseudomonadota bacterium]